MGKWLGEGISIVLLGLWAALCAYLVQWHFSRTQPEAVMPQVPEIEVLDLASLAAEINGDNKIGKGERSLIAGEMGELLGEYLERRAKDGVIILDSATVLRLPLGKVITREGIRAAAERWRAQDAQSTESGAHDGR